jgi:hypothetical protein
MEQERKMNFNRKPFTRFTKKAGKAKATATNYGAAFGLKDGLTWNVYAERTPQPRIPKGGQRVSVYKRHDLGVIATTSNSVGTPASLSFQLSDIAEYASYTTLYDQYKIRSVEVRLIPQGNTNGDGADSQWASVLDYDDATNLTSLEKALEYDTSVSCSFNDGMIRNFRPRVAVAAYAGAFTSFKNEKAGWIDCASPSVQHYGVKLYSEPTITNAQGIRAIVTYWIDFCSSR